MIKPVSTKWLTKTFTEINGFRWQEGYGAFTVGKANQQAVVNYIRNQEEHHKTVSFEEEFRRLLDLQGITYDKKYFLG